ncbi:undecaprenyl-phosphate glucose phosphotransferase [Vibrio vulnificus]|uniref:undecaprenyl-phosphate glucose phosphotransferase n=1 Tax=Vibrio vulnificus TaxID=672 RepID=UPI00031E999A|nr:undecaprenyl-phosphate glucose phosphotransferase [Vibrio vulnificus]AUL97586.1 Capsular polysaccharide synthesis enzyme CpsA, sugar transferase [Vibrio vulnificus]EGR0062276.1 undecaprenyl-phosphate glucose phosphotransferase [Vibrio vulnificus]EHV9834876.1 undecaprenyl-phosphate glucose phosphotransferase [Vibrio vulnificus]EIJ0969968.1 undecaprenyl-phosphate glucose phosphotransferase [Vibrio vulnificus]EIO4060141.1 undecaprenyl-phosphate glucose phosphotransferase [Vibrio vulnificus]
MNNKGLIRSHETEFSFLYRLADLTIIIGFMALLTLYHLTAIPKDYLMLAIVSGLIFILFAESAQLYRSWRTSSIRQQLTLACAAWLATSLLQIAIHFFTKTLDTYNEDIVTPWLLITPILLMCWRILFRSTLSYLRRLGLNTRTAIIVGQTPHGITLANELKNHTEHGVIFQGFYDERTVERDESNADYPIKGNVADALSKAKNGEVDYVYIAMPMHANERIAKFLHQFSDTTANTYLIPDFFTYNLLHSRWDQIGQVQTLSVFDTPFAGFSSWLKRFEDIVFSSLILLLISPILIAIAIGIKCTSRGPVIFKQDRYGLDGRKIRVWKFRSMTTMEQGSDVKQATKNDPRITPFGGFLRRTSLDELPQFINVLQGTMSIVGPRPHAVSHNEEYRQIVDRYMLRHKVKPGITGWAQINGYRGETDTLDKMEKRVEFDLDYIHRWSIWMDIKIIFLTVFKGFTGSNAY